MHNDVAPTGEAGILLADNRGIDRQGALRVFRPVNETHEIAVIEVAEAVHLVSRQSRVPNTRHDLRRKLEA